MKLNRWTCCFVLAVLAGMAAGCVWLRLLSFKNQLEHFDRYTRLDERNGLTVRFVKPVLYGDDLFVFLATRPSTRMTNGNQQTWSWTYRKLSSPTNAEPRNFDLTFEILLEDAKINGVRFPEQALAILPKPMILGFFRSVGQADIDRKAGTMKFKWVSGGTNDAYTPIGKEKLLRVLGTPYAATESNGTFTCLYKYTFAGSKPEPAWAKFSFGATSERLAASEGALGNVGWNLKPIPGGDGLQVKLFFVPSPAAHADVKVGSGPMEEYVGR